MKKMNIFRSVLFLGLVFGVSLSVPAMDLGLTAINILEINDVENTDKLVLSPWVSALMGENSEFYASGLFELNVADGDAESLFDLGRTQLSLRSAGGFSFDVGRLQFADAARLAVNGLYDGARINSSFSAGTVSLGLYYSGLLNKERVSLILSEADAVDFVDDDIKTAPGRIFIAAAFDTASLIPKTNISLGVTGQFDRREKEDAVNTRYLSLSMNNNFSQSVSLLTRAVIGQAIIGEADAELIAAADADLSLYLPGNLADRLYAGALWSSGDDGSFTSYLPVNGPSTGTVYSPAAVGLTVLRVGYFFRPADVFSADLTGRFFMSNGDGFGDPALDPDSNDSYLGTEVSASLLFAPFSDLSFIVQPGLFFPNSSAFLSSDTGYSLSISALLSL